MIALEDPPGFIVQTEAQKAASDNGYRLERGIEGGWLHYASTTAPGSVWIAGTSGHRYWLLSLDHSGVVAEIGALPDSAAPGPGLATFMLAGLTELHAALDRVYRLAVSLPGRPSIASRPRRPGFLDQPRPSEWWSSALAKTCSATH
jgi:hypothetical protein